MWKVSCFALFAEAQVTDFFCLCFPPKRTEIARRVAKILDAPFVKVEATRYTEVGFHGKDVDSIIQDLVSEGIRKTRALVQARLADQIRQQVETQILDALIGGAKVDGGMEGEDAMRADFLEMLRAGNLEDTEIQISLPEKQAKGDGLEQHVQVQIVSLMQNMTGEFLKNEAGVKPRRVKVRDARKHLEEEASAELCPEEDIVREALERVQDSGIVVIDEIDKICKPSGMAHYSADASAEGVQRDLLPIIEGTVITTKQGKVDTSKILFIASGAFHSVKPSDMLAELQGRLPIRVELHALTQDDLYRVLTETEGNLIEQQIALMGTEGVEVVVEDEAIREIARTAFQMNLLMQNIGARRLHSVIEKVFEDVSFDPPTSGSFTVTAEYVREKMKDSLKLNDMSRFLI